MKNEIVVNGVVLTREQIEGALKELNAPEVPAVVKLTPGTKFTYYGYKYLVINVDQVKGVLSRLTSGDSFVAVNSSGEATNWLGTRDPKMYEIEEKQ